MSDWQDMKLGDIAVLTNGTNFTKESFGRGLKILGVRDFGDRTMPDWDSMDEVQPAALSSDRHLLAEGDLVFVRSNGNPALVGRCMLITNGPKATHSGFTIKARPNQAVVIPGFLAYQMRHAHRAGLMRAANGTNITNLSQPILAAVPIRIPSRDTQKRVLEVLGSIDELIENTKRRVEVLEEMARTTYGEWFVHFRYPGHESARIVDSALGPIPERWKASTCGIELQFVGGGTPSKTEPRYWTGGTIPWYTPTDLTRTGWRYAAEPELRITELGVVKSSARRFPAGSVLMTSRATLGVLSIAVNEATTNQGFIVVLPDARWTSGFIYNWLDANKVQLAALGTGSTFKEITKGAFKNFPFVVPARDVLEAFRTTTQSVEDQVHVLERQARNLKSMRDVLLPKLVTGQIDVSRLDLGALLEERAA
jgi:type I restriction enzyme S subunit